MPKMPPRKTSSTAMMMTVLTNKFFCMFSRLLLCFLGFVVADHTADRGFDNFQPQIVRRDPQVDRIVLDGDNAAAKAALSSYTVPGLQLADHLLPLLLPALLGKNQQQI